MGLVWWPLLALGTVALLSGGVSGSPSHTLHFFYTSVWEPGQEVPQFIAVGQLDGVIGGQYDSHTRRARPRVSWVRRIEKDDPNFWDWNTDRLLNIELMFRGDLESLRKQHNQSGGIHTWQRMYGCELSEDQGETRGYAQYSYDGRDFLSFDKETLTWTATNVHAQMTKRKWDANLDRSWRIKNYLEGECMEWLRTFLEYGKEVLLRKESPKVKVHRGVGYDGLETLICRVHGFYPKEIDATWMRDGEVWEHETFRGGVVPNSDGTFHTWLRIDVDPKERDRYRCHVEHAGLAEPLDLAWEELASIPVGLIVGVTVALVALLALLVLVYIIRNRHEKGYETTPTKNLDPDGCAQA